MSETHGMTEHEKAEHGHAAHHGPTYGTFLRIWGALLCLTVLTVAVSRVDLGFMNKAVALFIASLKAMLVIFWFMHLKYENRVLKGMVATAFVVLAIFIGMTFFDVAYR